MVLNRFQTMVLVLFLPCLVYAHGGRTNAEGCHNDRKNGGYHCHGGGSVSTPVQLKQSNMGSNTSSGCGSKSRCGEMDSCDEALHYLNDCGVSRLDGDNDGTPCESICGN